MGVEPDDGAEDEVQVIQDLTADMGEADFGERNGLIQGSVRSGSVVMGKGHVTVRGEVQGDQGRECRIEVAETLVLEKRVRHARIRARHIVVQGDVAHSELHSDLGVEVQGSMTKSTVALGYRSGEIEGLRRPRSGMIALDKELSGLSVKVSAGARKFVRDYHQVDLRLGAILIPDQRELRVDLESYYAALKSKGLENSDKALQQFYLRVVVGMLTKANRIYVSQNPSRQKIFLKVIEELREHLLLVRREDALQEQLAAYQVERNTLLAALARDLPLSCRVRGDISPGCRIRALNLSDIRDSKRGVVEMKETWAETKILEGSPGAHLEAWDLRGKKTLIHMEAPIRNGLFELHEGVVAWKPHT